MDQICVYGDCDRPRGRAFGLCNAHYIRQSRGRPMEPPVRNPDLSDSERFWSKVNKTNDCWLWEGASLRGYGLFRINGGNQVAHRVSWRWANGDIPDGAEVDHMCFNRSCVRPSHLRLLSHRENGQNRASANRNSRSGVRGVYWAQARQGWMASAFIGDQLHREGPFDTVEEAEKHISAWRREHMPASLRDKKEAI